MSRYWLLLVLITNCLLSAGLLAQDKKPITLPKDPYAAIAAMPIAKPLAEGQVVKVIDGATKQPVAGAEVIALVDVRSEGFMKRVNELRQFMQTNKLDPKLTRLFMAAMMGTRFQTNAEGVAKVPPGKETFAVVVSGTKVSQWYPGLKVPVELFAPRFVTVQVLNSRGKPARNVEVGLGENDRYFQPTTRNKTDASGICKFEVTDRIRSNDLKVTAMIASDDLIEAAFQVDAIPKQPLQLQLPPCGQVRFILYGEDERPSNTLESALLNWKLSPEAAQRDNRVTRLLTAWPSKLDPDGALFAWVELDLDIEIAATIKGVPEALTFRALGPTREHELIIVDGRINTGPPIISFRVLDQQGQPVANEDLGKVLYSENSYGYNHARTDANGQLTIAFQNGPPESIYLLRRSKGEGTDYRGAVRLTLGELQPGKQQLADVQLQDEPVIASGNVVDAQGKPVAGLWLRSKTTIVSGGSGGGSRSRDMWYHTHRVCTDEQGHFEIREVAPADHALRLTIDNEEWALVDKDFTLALNDKDQTVRVGMATELQGELLGELKGARLDFKAVNRETGQEFPGRMGDGKFEITGLPAGSYDITFGRNGDYKIENVQSAKKGDAQDPRLRSDEWTKHFQLLETTVTDDNDKPLENITVYYYVKSKNGSYGRGARTNKQGKARQLSPFKNAYIEVKSAGYEPQKFQKDLKDLKVKLLPIAAIDVQIVGMPDLPDGVIAQATLSHQGRMGMRSGSGQRLVKGRAVMQPTALGKCQLRIVLAAEYQRGRSNQERLALRRALNLGAITFELTGTRKPTEPKVFQLDQDTIDDIQACLDDAREVLKKKDK